MNIEEKKRIHKGVEELAKDMMIRSRDRELDKLMNIEVSDGFSRLEYTNAILDGIINFYKNNEIFTRYSEKMGREPFVRDFSHQMVSTDRTIEPFLPFKENEQDFISVEDALRSIHRKDLHFYVRSALNVYRKNLIEAWSKDTEARYINNELVVSEPHKIIITDPCYILNECDANSNKDRGGPTLAPLIMSHIWGENYFPLNTFSNFIFGSTIYGDWSCTTYRTECDAETIEKKLQEILDVDYGEYDTDDREPPICAEIFNSMNPEPIGNFCADGGMVGVFYYDEVIKYNPDFEEDCRKYPHILTVIEDFVGTIRYVILGNSAYIIGEGNYNFFTTQTGY